MEITKVTTHSIALEITFSQAIVIIVIIIVVVFIVVVLAIVVFVVVTTVAGIVHLIALPCSVCCLQVAATSFMGCQARSGRNAIGNERNVIIVLAMIMFGSRRCLRMASQDNEDDDLVEAKSEMKNFILLIFFHSPQQCNHQPAVWLNGMEMHRAKDASRKGNTAFEMCVGQGPDNDTHCMHVAVADVAVEHSNVDRSKRKAKNSIFETGFPFRNVTFS